MRLEFDNTEFIVEKEYQLGDGIVPIHSANLGERYSSKTYYQQVSHNYIAMQEATVNFVKAVINNASSISVNGIVDHVG